MSAAATATSIARRLAVASLKAGAAAVDVARPPVAGVSVLLYHQVGGPRAGEVNLTPTAFDGQIAALADRGGTVDLDVAIDLLTDGRPDQPPRQVVTFDDGTADFVDHAVPILVRHGVPATLYVATRWVDEGRSFWDDGTVLSWGALRDALSTGLVTVGSHTHSHVLLDRLPPDQIDDELDRSIGLIEDNLGVACRHFAYPKALAPSARADQAVRARFGSAALAGTRPNPYGRTDPYRLARSPVQVSDGSRWFECKSRGGMWFEDRVREIVNRRRYAGATR